MIVETVMEERAAAPPLSANGMVKIYTGRRVVDGVSVQVRPGEVVGLLGPNGAGKSTTFNMLVGMVRPDAGRVSLGDLDLTSMPMFRRARAGIGYLPQDASIFRKLTVKENFLAVLEGLGISKAEQRERAEQLLREFGLEAVAETRGEALSGGERRRCEIARSLIPGPTYILFDEPFAGVDPINVGEIQRQIADLRDRGLGVLITDHNVRETLGICDRAYIIAEGKIIEEGTPAEVAGSERARSLYLGEKFRLD